jgi:hypothetical protein
MPRYFFTVTYPDHEIDNPEGTLLSSDNADALRKDHKSEGDLGPTIVVKNEAGGIIYRYPSN